jgi:hypothetical protein
VVDQDTFTRTAAAGWSRSARAVREVTSADVLGSQLEEDLYRVLRRRGGLRDGLLHRYVIDAQRFEDPSESDQDLQVPVTALSSYVWDRCLGPLVPLMVGPDGVFESVAVAEAYCQKALRAARLDEAAERLQRHPDGRGLRRPARRRVSTRELLDEDMPGGHGW